MVIMYEQLVYNDIPKKKKSVDLYLAFALSYVLLSPHPLDLVNLPIWETQMPERKLGVSSTLIEGLHGYARANLMLLQQCDVRSVPQEQAVRLVMHVQYSCLVKQLVATGKFIKQVIRNT